MPVDKPRLRHPSMVCGIDGWVNGGEAATGTVQYLVDKLGATKFAEIPITEFHIFQVPGQLSLRPHVRIEGGILKEHHFPTNEFFYWVNPVIDNDLIIFLGSEPNMNWEEYAGALLSVAKQFKVDRIYLLGGVLDKVPYAKEPNVSCSCSSLEIRNAMQKYGISGVEYEGPGSFGTTLLHICQDEPVSMVSLVARAAYYPEFKILIPRNPKSIRALVRRLESILHIDLDASELEAQVEEFEGKLDSMVGNNLEFRNYIEKLEQEYTEMKYEKPLDISPDEAVRIAEEFIRKKPDN
jgi:proteasome assembly chaperone (PAC2) family protein